MLSKLTVAHLTLRFPMLTPFHRHSLLVYAVGFQNQKFSKLKFLNVHFQNESLLPFAFKCSEDTSTSWKLSTVEVNQTWLPVNRKHVCGLICTWDDTETPSNLVTTEVQCSDEADVIRATCLTEISVAPASPDQHTLSLSIGDANHQDVLYLYYIHIHGYHPPSVSESQVPLVTRLVRNPHIDNTTEEADSCDTTVGHRTSWPLMLIGHAGAGVKRALPTAGQQCGSSIRWWPENTVAGFQRAEQVGLRAVECDAGVTRDGCVVLHHNFTVRLQQPSGNMTLASSMSNDRLVIDEQQFADVARRCELEHMPDKSVDETTQNLLARYSLAEIHSLVGRQQSDAYAASPLVSHPAARTIDDKPPDINGREGQPLPTLSEALRQTSTELMFNVEFKYPSETMFGRILRALDFGQAISSDLPGPHTYFYRINEFCNSVLDAIWLNAGPRKMIMSSFNPDVCATLKFKQTRFPVLFITRGGIHPDSGTQNWSHVDPRHMSLQFAISWAKVCSLTGVVTLGQHFGSDPSSHQQSVEEMLALSMSLANENLCCFVYGPGVSSHAFRETARRFHLTGLIIDNVDQYMHEFNAQQSSDINRA